MNQYVFRFGGGTPDGDDRIHGNKNLLGGKGANLDGMAIIGLRVLPGFTINSEMCARDSFISLEVECVGELVRPAADRGCKTRAQIKPGICGKHGGDPASIQFCEGIRLESVFASPYRVIAARLATAHA